jgi:hypothetical protein
MWPLETTSEYQRRHKRFEKKRRRELAAVLENLDTLVTGLKEGLKLEQVRTFGFVHHEPHGVLAIDQKGGHGAKLAQTRLYVYPEPKRQVIDVITLGDKTTQESDIRFCSEFVASIQGELKSHEPEMPLR